jgi:hypothetical protein
MLSANELDDYLSSALSLYCARTSFRITAYISSPSILSTSLCLPPPCDPMKPLIRILMAHGGGDILGCKYEKAVRWAACVLNSGVMAALAKEAVVPA